MGMDAAGDRRACQGVARHYRARFPANLASTIDMNGTLRFVRRLSGRRARRGGGRSAVICGVSFGGLIALRYAARRPARTDALILVSTPGPRWKLKPHLARYMKWPTLSSPLFFAGAVGRFWPELRVTYPDAGQRVRFCAAAMSRVDRSARDSVAHEPACQLAAARTFEGDCACVKAPTLVVTGERDLDRVVTYDETMDYVSLIDGARFQLLERTGHLGIISAPDRFAAIVSRFCRRHMTDDIRVINVDIPGPAGLLEGLINAKTATEPRAIAVLAHPLPTAGGTMHTKAVFHAAKALARIDVPVLRFNFRGVGRSAGSFSDGPGEQEDFRAALAFMMARYPDVKRIWCGGMSFGSWVALTVGAEEPDVTALIGIACPVNNYDYSAVVAARKPTFLIHGERDELIPLQEIRRFYALLSEPKELVVIDGADHLFDGKVSEVGEAIEDLLQDFNG